MMRLGKFVAVAGLFAFLASAGSAMAQECPIKLGAILPVSGPMGQVGERISNTGAFAVEVFNEAGGVKNCPVEYTLRDTQGQSAVGVDAAKSLVDLEGVSQRLLQRIPFFRGKAEMGMSAPTFGVNKLS